MKKQEKIKKDQEIIEEKQKAYNEDYRKKREGLMNLSWRERVYLVKKSQKESRTRQSEKDIQSDKNMLPLIIKGIIIFLLLIFVLSSTLLVEFLNLNGF